MVHRWNWGHPVIRDYGKILSSLMELHCPESKQRPLEKHSSMCMAHLDWDQAYIFTCYITWSISLSLLNLIVEEKLFQEGHGKLRYIGSEKATTSTPNFFMLLAWITLREYRISSWSHASKASPRISKECPKGRIRNGLESRRSLIVFASFHE